MIDKPINLFGQMSAVSAQFARDLLIGV